MILDEILLKRIRNNDLTLTSLDLGRNQIGAAGAKAVSEALKHNTTLTSLDLEANLISTAGAKDLSEALKHNTTLTSLNLGRNQIDAAGAKDLSEALKHNTTLTLLDLGYNQIGDACLKEINALLQRNQQARLARRQQFIYKMILLARDIKSSNPQSLWCRLPKEIRYLILASLNFQGETQIGKTRKQVYQCAKFIFDNIDECNELIKDKQAIKLLENKNAKGEYQFQFFKSSAYCATKKQNTFSMNQYANQADIHKRKNL
jgi:hypothetical protein